MQDIAKTFQSFKNPTLYGDPNYYKGELWNDNSEVHTNSSYGNHRSLRLVEGGSVIIEEYQA